MVGGVAATHFAMPKLLNVLKENYLHTEHGLDVFFTNSNHNKLILLLFLILNKMSLSIFFQIEDARSI